MRGLQVANRAIGLAEGQIFGRRPRRDALEQLLDALHLLLQRPLGGGALFVVALPHAGYGFGKPRRDRLVEPVGLAGEGLPLVGDRAPFCVAILRGRAFAAPAAWSSGMDSRSASSDNSPSLVWTRFERLAVLVPFGCPPAGLVETRPELGVLALLRGGARHAFPLGPRLVRARRAYPLRAGRRRARRSRRSAARRAAARSTSASRSASSRRRASMAARDLGQLVVNWSFCSGLAGTAAVQPALPSARATARRSHRAARRRPSSPACSRSRRAAPSRGPTRFCHSSSAAFFAASASSISWTRARARLADRLVLRASGDAVEQLATLGFGCRRVGGALEGGDARLLVVRLGGDGDELGLIGHARPPPRAQSARRRHGARRWRAP